MKPATPAVDIQSLIAFVQRSFGAQLSSIELTEHSDLMSDVGLSSMSMIKLLSHIEQEYDIDIFAQGLNEKNVRTLASLHALIARSRQSDDV